MGGVVRSVPDIAPVIEQIAAEFSGRGSVGKLDVDANPRTASRFAVQSIPTLLILKDGREVDRLIAGKGSKPSSSTCSDLFK